MGTLQAIEGARLFRGLTAGQCAPFAPLAREQRFAKGETLFKLGDEASVLFVVRSGVVELTMPLSVHGAEQELVVGEAHPGETVAWSALIEPHRCTMSARAGSDVELLGFARADLQGALRADPETGMQVLTNLGMVVGRRLQVMQALWTRELQRSVNLTLA